MLHFREFASREVDGPGFGVVRERYVSVRKGTWKGWVVSVSNWGVGYRATILQNSLPSQVFRGAEHSRARGHSASSLKLMSCNRYEWIRIKSRPGRCAGPVYKLDIVGDGSVCRTHSVHDRKIISCEGKREGGTGLQGKRDKKETHSLNFA